MRKKKFSKDRAQKVNTEIKQAKKINKKMLIIVGFILFTMVFSAIAISFFNRGNSGPTVEKIEYNGFKFRNINNIWSSTINGIQYNFEYSPADVKDIKSIDLKIQDFNRKIYLLFDPGEFNENSKELLRLRIFLLGLNPSVNLACIKEDDCGDLPIINCDAESESDPGADFVYLKIGENTQIYKEGICVVLESKKGMEVAVINRFMYNLFGVIDEKES